MRLLLHTPVSLLMAEYDRESLRSLRFWRQGVHPPADTRDEPARGDALGHRLVLQIEAYFAGEGRGFDLPLRPASTPFRQAVRDALCAIPYGEVRSYGEIAEAIGHPGAARAVGQANASNPYPLVVPCHRVLAAGNRSGGFSAEGGAATKLRMLEIERARFGGEPGLFDR